jgi:hypothetical protein
MFESAIISAIVAFIKGLFGIKPKDPMQEVLKHDATVAEKQAAIVADRTEPDASASLHNADF